jgi:glucose-6-phosphate 1-dehydrogenase
MATKITERVPGFDPAAPLATTDTPPNPLMVGLDTSTAAEPATIIIFGITGDLAARKLVPALYNLALDGLLPNPVNIVGVGRRPWTDDSMRQTLRGDVEKFSRRPINETLWTRFASSLYYQNVSFDQVEDFKRLAGRLTILDKVHNTGNRLFYLAIPPDQYETVAQNLGAAGLNSSHGYTRIIVEKPFGHDLASAKQLNAELRSVFHEEQIYRIDHYLGKETVQNIQVFRFANSIFEPLWNHRYIDHVQMTIAETVGVGTRGGFYDKAGALRDIVQNHALQVLSMVTMEPPIAWDAQDIRDEKVKLLRSIRPIKPADVNHYSVRAQYSAGTVADDDIKGYLETDEVDPHSQTETYVALKLLIDNWRWSGVPFYLRTGKALAKRVTEVAVEFKQPPAMLFNTEGTDPNRLILRIQPDEGITMRFNAKLPGQANTVRDVNMDFRYGTSFGKESAEAYERLLLDAMLGDNKLFARNDEVEVAWTLINNFLEGWAAQDKVQLPQYTAGSWGPRAADEWIEEDGRHWRRL